MAWTDRILDYVPSTPDRVGALALFVSIIGAGVAVMLANLPLAIAASGLSIAGALGPVLYTMKQTRNSPEPTDPRTLSAEEDAAVEQFVEQSERVGRFLAMIQSENCPPQGRWH